MGEQHLDLLALAPRDEPGIGVGDRACRTSVTVCLLSELTHTSQWVTWELQESVAKGSKIIAMGFPRGPTVLVLPEPVSRLKLGWWMWDLDVLQREIVSAP